MSHGIIHSKSQNLIDFAYEYAKEVHGDQVRKYTGEPYINHPVAVAHLVAAVTDDCNAIAAAFLHDVIEMTETSFEAIRDAGFGFQVATLVLQVTDISLPTDGTRAFRKALDQRYLSRASGLAKTIKLADVINNVESIAQYDPQFADIYIEEKANLLTVLADGDPLLFMRANRFVDEYLTAKGEVK